MHSFLTEIKTDCKAVEQPESGCLTVFLRTAAPNEKGPKFFKIGHLTDNKWCLKFSHEMFNNLLI
jgi:hypothetical protein